VSQMRWEKGDATYYGFPGKDFEEELRNSESGFETSRDSSTNPQRKKISETMGERWALDPGH